MWCYNGHLYLFAASPATWALLQSYGWSCLPAKVSAETDAEAGQSPYAVATAEATTLAGEFDAEC